jgi:tetratricopeptide (TPR) repeat protein
MNSIGAVRGAYLLCFGLIIPMLGTQLNPSCLAETLPIPKLPVWHGTGPALFDTNATHLLSMIEFKTSPPPQTQKPDHPIRVTASIEKTLRPYINIGLLALLLFFLYQKWRQRFHSRSWNYFKKGNVEKAIATLKEAAEHYPKDYRVYYNWGWFLMKDADNKQDSEAEKLLQEANDQFGKASRLKPNQSDILRL